jgi:hypothetical protein
MSASGDKQIFALAFIWSTLKRVVGRNYTISVIDAATLVTGRE